MFKFITLLVAGTQAINKLKERGSILHKVEKPGAKDVICAVASEQGNIGLWYEWMMMTTSGQNEGLNLVGFQNSLITELAEHEQQWTLKMGEDFNKDWN